MTPRCDVCGDDGTRRSLTIVFSKRGQVETTCEFCQGLIDAGLIRPEQVDGELRWRQWHPEWKPGELLPGRF